MRSLIIFNGLKFPYYLMEHVIGEAKKQPATIHTLFLKAKKEVSEGYGFPSDLDAAEELISADEAAMDDTNIINHHMKLAIDMSESEGIPCTTELSIDCSLKNILKTIETYDKVYIDEAFDDESNSMLYSHKFSLSQLMEHAPGKIEVVEAP